MTTALFATFATIAAATDTFPTVFTGEAFPIDAFISADGATDTYIDFYQHYAGIPLLLVLILGLARLLPFMFLAPFLGARLLPGPVKVGMALSFLMILLPHLMATITTPLVYNARFVGYVFKEMLMGTILGFLIAIPFYVVQASGTNIDHQRGAQSLMVTDPAIANQVSPIGLLYNYLLIATFFLIDGPFIFLDGMIHSYNVMPPDQFFSVDFFEGGPFWDKITEIIGHVARLALQLAAPAMMAILMTDMFLGIANRLAPQVQVTFLGLALKSFIGIVMLGLAWRFILQQITKETLTWFDGMKDFVSLIY